MAKGKWKRRLGWAVICAMTVVILLAATWRTWTPTATRLALRLRGVKVQKISWVGEHSWKLEGIERRAKGGLVTRARSVTMLTPFAWKKAIEKGDTNQIFLTIDGWRLIFPQTNQPASSTNSIATAERIRRLNDGLHQLQKRCPNAVFLNGTMQFGAKEFNFASIQWKNGELNGDMTWPMLNDPADFRLKLLDDTKTQLILKQTAIEIGARITSEILTNGARLFGYARWKTNRADFDLAFARGENIPNHGFIESKGLAIPGRFVGMPEVDSLNARMRLVVTNGQFDFRMGAPLSEP